MRHALVVETESGDVNEALVAFQRLLTLLIGGVDDDEPGEADWESWEPDTMYTWDAS